MPIELERLEDRLAPTAVPVAPPEAPRVAVAPPVSPAESEAALDPLRTRLGPRQEPALLFPASASYHAAPALVAPLAPGEELEDEPDDDGAVVPLEKPTEAMSDRLMQADLAD